MSKLKTAALAAAGLVAVLGLGPLVVPLPPGPTGQADELADADSTFLTLDGVRIHAKVAGSGSPTLVLLHGFGASLSTWREVMPGLAARGTTIAYDRLGFGLSQRPMSGEWQGGNPYGPDAAVSQLLALLDGQGVERAVLVGNSAGGAVAVQFALRHPERVQALVLVSAAVYAGGGAPAWAKPLLRTPQLRRVGPLAVRYFMESRGDDLIKLAWHDPSRASAAVIADYRKPTQVADWDRALWEFTLASEPSDLAARVAELRVPTLVIAGDDDRIVPTAQSVRLAGEIPGAKLVVIPECGHTPQEERPAEFLRAVDDFLITL